MDDREQRRKIRHRLAVLRCAEEVSGSVAATCRYYGISRTVFYKQLPLRGAGRRGAQGPLVQAAPQPQGDPLRGGGQDRVSAPALPLRPAEDLHVPQALLRHRDLQLGGVEGARPPGAYACCASTPATTRRPLSSSSTTSSSGSPSESRRSRPTTEPNSNPASTGTSWTAASATSTSSPPPPGSTARSSGRTASTQRSSTACSTASSSTTPTCSTTSPRQWEDYYNFDRPHGALGGQTPYERLKQKTTQP